MTQMVDRRRFLQYMGVAAVSAGPLITACESAAGPSVREVLFWNSFTNDQAKNYFQSHFVDAYNQQSTTAKIKLEAKPSADISRLTQTALAAGQGPDILITSFANRLDPSYLRPLDVYEKQYSWKDKILPFALDTGRSNGKLYYLPFAYDAMVLMYNPELFAAKGWKLPTNRSEFEALCADAQAQGIMPLAAGNADWKPGIDWFVSIFLNHVAGPMAVYQGLTGKVPFSDGVFVDSIALLKRYFQKGWFGGGVQAYFTNHFDALFAKLAQGKAALMMTGNWAFNDALPFFGAKAGNDSRWDWAPIPPLSSIVKPGMFAIGAGAGLSINAKSKVADDAAAFLNWWFSGKARITASVADIGLRPMPIPLAASDFPSASDPRLTRFYVTVGDAGKAGNLGYVTWAFFPPKSETYIYTDMPKVLTGDLTPASYCQQLDAIFKGELAAGTVPPSGPPGAYS